MSAIEERRAFSERLQEALRKADYSPDSPTQLAREFNLRSGGSPITVHGARKWLMGETIPTQEKLRILAQWLGVPAEWLRFGDDAGPGADGNGASPGFRLEPGELAIIENMRRLDDKHRQIVQALIRMLVQAENQGQA